VTEAEKQDVITTDEAMEILGLSRSTVTRLIKDGELKARRLTPRRNSPYRIYRSSIEDFLRRRQV
jgi:excisionase family DNA binding protein